MAGAIIVIDQPNGAGAGSPGVARNDLWQLQQINLSCASVNARYQWDLLDVPPGSGTTLTGAGTSTPHFLPDLIGTYRIQLITNGGGPGNVQILIIRVRFNSVGVLQNHGWAPPAFGEQSGESNYGGNLRGWSEAMEFILSDASARLVALESGGGASTNTPPLTNGNGADGAVVISTTVTLTQDMVAASLHITSTGHLKSNSFRVFCQSIPVIDSGGIWEVDGAAGGADGTGGVGAGAGTVGATFNGANSTTTVGADADAAEPCLSGNGGNGGAGSAGGGGLGGAASINPVDGRGLSRLDSLINSFQAGPGGGGGGGDGTHPGGGGGSGGGCLTLYAPGLSNNGTISCKGGPGGSPILGNTGGGGGGSGGKIDLLLGQAWTGTGVVDVSGGAGGVGHNTGTNGSPGGIGHVLHP